MGLFDLLMIEDICNRVENNNKSRAGGTHSQIGCFSILLILVLIFLIGSFKETIGIKFKPYLSLIVALTAIFTLAIPFAIKKKQRNLARVLMLINVIVGFALMSILVSLVMDGFRVSTLIEENMDFAGKIDNFVLKLVVVLFLGMLSPIGLIFDLAIIPLFTIPFLQKQLWRIF